MRNSLKVRLARLENSLGQKAIREQERAQLFGELDAWAAHDTTFTPKVRPGCQSLFDWNRPPQPESEAAE